jgi:hypothetical protein
MTFISTELFDLSALQILIDHWDDIELPDGGKDEIKVNGVKYDPHQLLVQYHQQANKVDEIANITVNYQYSRFHQNDKVGRLYVERGCGLQSFKKWIRNTLNHKIYADYDMVNAHPTILSQYCYKNNIACPMLDKYVAEREEILSQLMKKGKITRDQAKQCVLATLNGGKRYINSKWFDGLKDEIKTIHKSITDMPEHQELLNKLKDENKKGKKEKKILGQVVNHVLCRIENNLLMKVVEFLQLNGINSKNIILEFDGFELPKDQFKPTPFFFTQLNTYLKDQVGYDVPIIEKKKEYILDLTKYKGGEAPPLRTPPKKEVKEIGHIDFSLVKSFMNTDEDGNKTIDVKRVVDYLNKFLRYVNLSSPPQLIEITDRDNRGFVIRKVSQCEHAIYAPITKFYSSWLFSPYRAEIKKLTYVPFLFEKPKEKAEEWNLFGGFKHQYDPNFVVDENKITYMLSIIKNIWCCRNPILYEYVINWFSHKLQKPDKKMGIALIVKSLLQGAGKNTFFDFFINYVMGSQFGLQVGNADKLFGNFNSAFEWSLLVLCDEIGNNGAMYKNADILKSIITRTVQNIEGKGIDERPNVPDYNDYIMFSNNDFIVRAEASDRRNVCLEASNEKVGDHDYWDMVYKEMNDDSGLHMFHYLAKRDISQFNPRKIPMTTWKRELKDKSLDPIMKSVIMLIKSRFDSKNKQWRLDETRFQNYEFYQQYEIIEGKKEHINDKVFSKRLQNMLCIEPLPSPFKKGGIQGRGISITINELQDIK